MTTNLFVKKYRLSLLILALAMSPTICPAQEHLHSVIESKTGAAHATGAIGTGIRESSTATQPAVRVAKLPDPISAQPTRIRRATVSKRYQSGSQEYGSTPQAPPHPQGVNHLFTDRAQDPVHVANRPPTTQPKKRTNAPIARTDPFAGSAGHPIEPFTPIAPSVDPAPMTQPRTIPLVTVQTLGQPQPLGENQTRFEYKVENTDVNDSPDVIINLDLSGQTRVVQVNPVSAMILGSQVRFRMDSMTPGESQIISIVTASLDNRPVTVRPNIFLREEFQNSIQQSFHQHRLNAFHAVPSTLANQPAQANPAKNRITGSEQISDETIEPFSHQTDTDTISDSDQNPTQTQASAMAASEPPQIDSVSLQPATSQTITRSLETSIQGPVVLKSGNLATYRITVVNVTKNPIHDIQIQMDLVAGLEVTILDRNAEFDRERNVMIWQLPELGPEQKEIIQFKAESSQPGIQQLMVKTMVERAEQSNARLATNVVGRQDLQVTIVPSNTNLEIDPASNSMSVRVDVENVSGQSLAKVDLVVELPEGITVAESNSYRTVDQTLLFNPFALEIDCGRTVRLNLNLVTDNGTPVATPKVMRAIARSELSKSTATASQALRGSVRDEFNRMASGFDSNR